MLVKNIIASYRIMTIPGFHCRVIVRYVLFYSCVQLARRHTLWTALGNRRNRADSGGVRGYVIRLPCYLSSFSLLWPIDMPIVRVASSAFVLRSRETMNSAGKHDDVASWGSDGIFVRNNVDEKKKITHVEYSVVWLEDKSLNKSSNRHHWFQFYWIFLLIFDAIFQAGTEASRRRIARWRGSSRARTCIWSPARSTMKASSSPSYRWRIRWYGKSPWFCGNGVAFGRGCMWWVHFVPSFAVSFPLLYFNCESSLCLCALRLKGIFSRY